MKVKRVIRWSVRLILAVLVIGFLIAYWTSTNDCGKPVPAGDSMKAIIRCDYGSADSLKLADVPKPHPNDNQVLVRVHAASINPYDWHLMRGIPYLVRLEMGLRKPKSTHLGVDFSGKVEAVGKNVTQFKAGDEVFGGRDGALAQYVCVTADHVIAQKPAELNFEQAACIPLAGITALQGLRDKGHVQPGQKVLINGASGGVGTFAVQIAKSLGAEVTAVCSGKNAGLVRSLGADHVIDYTKEDFTKSDQRYDVILDCVGTQPLSSFRHALMPKGIGVLIGGGGPNDGNWIGPMARPVEALIMSPFINQKMGMFLANLNHDDLDVFRDLIQAGKVKTVIDRTYPLADTAAAIRYLEEGHAHGKVIITVE